MTGWRATITGARRLLCRVALQCRRVGSVQFPPVGAPTDNADGAASSTQGQATVRACAYLLMYLRFPFPLLCVFFSALSFLPCVLFAVPFSLPFPPPVGTVAVETGPATSASHCQPAPTKENETTHHTKNKKRANTTRTTRRGQNAGGRERITGDECMLLSMEQKIVRGVMRGALRNHLRIQLPITAYDDNK